MSGEQHGVALVTGAAGGIGSAVVRALAERGARVAAVDRAGDQLRSATASLAADGFAVEPFVVDVTREDEVWAAVAEVERALGPVDRLVNTAGVLHVADVCDTSATAWNEMLAVNATGVFTVTRAVVRRMIPRRRGAIVTVASNAAAVPRSRMAGYAASKAAATMFTKSLGGSSARGSRRASTPVHHRHASDLDVRVRVEFGRADTLHSADDASGGHFPLRTSIGSVATRTGRS
ncbi:SDR family NAD(P)-dependent oxidoreductase [Nocardia arizonensis]|uniref:SDR family NAD(P)-dependent oxidoreductase n=1 Tax=Nocardia arizonensis TaxID=1141647 RepID=UPI0006D02738|nr:SDR family NAD(P)-dependent oxidoreductase [Nocardia arizonensis]